MAKPVMERKTFREELRNMVSGRVLFDEPMNRHTSMGVGGKADALVFPESSEELAKLISFLRSAGVPFLPVGNCTNLIVRDGGFRGVLVSLRNLRGKALRWGGDEAVLKVGAGIPLSEVVGLAVDEALTGMEFCAGIPGSVGGGLKMNAGAFGREMKDVVVAIALVNGSGIKSIAREELTFTYRNLDLPRDAVVTGAEFSLHRASRELVRARVAEILAIRKSRHPLQYRSAGSVFKNPASAPAGKLIDEAGLKGTRIGGAMVSDEHGNFIVNTGAATAEDVVALVELIESRVFEKTGVRLEREVKIIGEEEGRS